MCPIAARVPCLNLRRPVRVRRYATRSAAARRRGNHEVKPVAGSPPIKQLNRRLCLGTLRVDQRSTMNAIGDGRQEPAWAADEPLLSEGRAL